MKIAIVCFNCYKPKRFSNSYVVKIQDFTDMYSETPSVAEHKNLVPIEKKVRICRTCAKRMGYKVKKPKKANKDPFTGRVLK